MHDSTHRARHPKRVRLPVWVLALGAVGLLVLLVGGIVGVAFLGEQFIERPPGDATPPTVTTDRDRPALPIGR